MDSSYKDWIELILRWTHVVAGVMWIGHLFFFNFVNGQVAKTYDPDSRKKVVPELMPRALYWFRWGALYTWVTGFLLVGMVYYMQPNLLPAESTMDRGMAIGLSVALIVIVFFIYDVLWKALAANETVGVAVSFVITVAACFGLSRVFGGRALYIHLGILFGTIMAMNVWMRIWPAQRKIIAAIKAGNAPEASLAAMAGLRSKQNTYMAVPLIFSMVSNHYPLVYGSDYGWVILVLAVAIGWAVAKLLYGKAASAVTAKY
jgi:uncharacterized membrane protein